MNRYDVLVDISSQQINERFQLELSTKNYGGFSDPDGDWAALDISQPTTTLLFEVRFPASKPPKNLRYTISTLAERRNYQPLEESKYRAVQHDPCRLDMGIKHPLLGHAYRVDWQW